MRLLLLYFNNSKENYIKIDYQIISLILALKIIFIKDKLYFLKKYFNLSCSITTRKYFVMYNLDIIYTKINKSKAKVE